MLQHPVQKARILIVDDERDVLFLGKLLLSNDGYEVMVSLNADGLDDIITYTRPDIILLDITMNGIDGSQICKNLKAKEETKEIVIIMFSANDNISQITRECGADDYMVKPFIISAARKKLNYYLRDKN